jgi:serine phosphatase RsbU (regulator of sigma subunit)
MPALAKFEPDPAIQPDWKGIFLSIIGACQNAAKERIEGELSIAREIQMSMVPSTFPEREGLDMYATMTPAREVGGDNKGDFLNMLPNAPIGLWPGLEYEGEEIGSIKGRPLFIYTDGLNEAEDRQQKQFGDDRMLDILRQTQFVSAKQVIETMAEAVSQYRNGAEPNDDLSMMCICLKEPLSVCKM